MDPLVRMSSVNKKSIQRSTSVPAKNVIKIGGRKQPSKPQKRSRFPRRFRITAAPMSMGYSARVTANLHTSAGNATLVSREMFQVTAISGGLSYMLPLTPTKWQSTRTAQLAGTYTDFRPLRVKISWMPAIGTNTSGSVAVGTVWSGARLPTDSTSFDNISRALASTNGGFITTVWKPMTSTVALGANLIANNYPMYEVSPDDVPFWIVVATDVTPGTNVGTLFVDIQMSLKNPITAFRTLPVSATGLGTIVEDSASTLSPKPKYLQFDNSDIGTDWRVGDDFTIASNSTLVNASDETIINPLEPILIKVAEATFPQGKTWFNVDQAIKLGSSFLATFIGRAAQSFFQ